MILAGDVGGTHTRVALFDRDGLGRLVSRLERSYASGDHDGLESIIDLFLREAGAPRGAGGWVDAATFGVAGPVRRGRSETTNLPWVIESPNPVRR